MVIKEIRAQRRKKIGERDGRAIYSDERDETIVDHAYDTIKYHLISRPGVVLVPQNTDPNVIDLKDLMAWSAQTQRQRVRAGGGY
jgi:hypothetical protein